MRRDGEKNKIMHVELHWATDGECTKEMDRVV